jgi:putative endonuclease
MDRKTLGQSGEDRAAEFLVSLGYTILMRNKRYSVGEIDILAKDGATIVIVEVKAGRTGQFGYAYERVGPNKQHKLRQLARRLSQDYPRAILRIDLIDVDPESGVILHYPNAIQSQ